jgi:hypothetical protein
MSILLMFEDPMLHLPGYILITSFLNILNNLQILEIQIY